MFVICFAQTFAIPKKPEAIRSHAQFSP